MYISIEPNALYYGDCLEVMAQFPSDYVDLIYLDPPFNSDEKYNTIFKGRHGLRNIDPQIKAFDDTWTWNDASAQRVAQVKGAVANRSIAWHSVPMETHSQVVIATAPYGCGRWTRGHTPAPSPGISL